MSLYEAIAAISVGVLVGNLATRLLELSWFRGIVFLFLTAVGIIGVIWVTPTISKIISEGFEELSSIDGLDYLHINFSIIAALLPIALVLILVINILRNWPGNNW